MTRSLTVGAPTRVIVGFTLPLLIGNLFQQAYQFTDAVVIGRLVGVNALAAVGASGSLVFLLLGFTLGAANGLSIPVARAFGAGAISAMRRHVAIGALVSAAISGVIVLIGLRFTRTMLTWMQTPEVLMEDATTFLTISFVAAPVTMAFNYLAAIIRALGDSTTPLLFLMIACLVNVALVVLFIGEFGWGVAGAAWATAVAQLASVVACLWLVRVRMPQLWLWREDWIPRLREWSESVRPGLAMGFQMSVIAIGAVILQYAINGLGSDAVAAATAAIRVDQVAIAPLASFGLALTTFVAQNRGAGLWRRIRVGVWEVSLLSWGVAVLMGGLIYLFGTDVAALFVGEESRTVVTLAHDYLVIQSLLYPVLASLFVLRNAVQGMGSNLIPTVAGFMELVFRALAGLLLVAPLGFLGVSLAAPLAWVGAVIPVAIAWMVVRRDLIRREAPQTSVRRPRREALLSGV